MCRLLSVSSSESLSISEYATAFAEMSQQSKEYQGHGWGMAVLNNGAWRLHHSITPIWEDDLSSFGEGTRFLLHARSAFQDEGIVVENNMPFVKDGWVFLFNGELRGVRLKQPGRIGAEKIFHLFLSLLRDDAEEALRRTYMVLKKRTRFLRAANIILANKDQTLVGSYFAEEKEYFTLWRKESLPEIVCSAPLLSLGESWAPIPHDSVCLL